jgi:CheY-like chemotaxis protein/HPt (histidine-containing phosphotransfer) domain-containing protein
LELEETTFDLTDVVASVVDLFAPQAAAKGIEIATFIDTGMPLGRIGDGSRLRQILMNLVGNAVKFTARGGVSVLVGPDTGDRVHFEVRDTGIGISPDRIDALFEEFSQADDSISRRYGGTGLGLAICRRLSELMGGEITVSSTEGAGSIFRVEVPLPIEPEQSRRLVQPEALDGLRCLIVDDVPLNVEIFRRQLSLWGVVCQSTLEPTTALDLLTRAADDGAPFDVVILDHQMPGLTGVELARLLRADPRLSGVRMILASSTDDSLETGRDKLALFDRVLRKPVQPLDLMAAVAGGVVATPPTDSTEHPLDLARPLEILVAEDNSINRILMETALKSIGHGVTMAADGIEAVAAATRRKFDVILMDIEMPEMDGEQATQRIREVLGGPPPTIIALTAHAGEGLRERYLSIGFDDYMAKPLDFDRLQALLADVAAAPSPPPAPRDLAPAIDADRIEALSRALDRDTLASMVDRFSKGIDDMSERLTTALETGDYETASRAAHTLKGLCLNFGANGLADRSAAAEAILSQGERPGQSEMDGLRDMMAVTKAEAAQLASKLRDIETANG